MTEKRVTEFAFLSSHQALDIALLKKKSRIVYLPPHRPSSEPLSTSDILPDPDESSLAGFRIGVINYGMGNQQSLINALTILGSDVVLTDQQNDLSSCDLLMLPGVGAFPKGMEALRLRGLDAWLCNEWVSFGKPLLGICLGMQMLFESSSIEENGLGLVPGHVKSLPIVGY